MDNQIFAIVDSTNDTSIFLILIFVLFLSLKEVLSHIRKIREMKGFELTELYEIQNEHNVEIEQKQEEIDNLKQQLNEKT